MEQLMPWPISPIENGSEVAAAATEGWRGRIHLHRLQSWPRRSLAVRPGRQRHCEQIDRLWSDLEAEKIVKGWQRLVWLDKERIAPRAHRMLC
jgi:hypothetical protein